VLTVLVGVNLYVFLWRGGTSIPDVMEAAAVAGEASEPGSAGKGLVDTYDELETDEVPEDDTPEPASWTEGEVIGGDSLGKILKREGLEPSPADELIRGLRPHMDLRKIHPGQTYRIQLDDAKNVLGFEFRVSRTETVAVGRDENGALAGKKLQAATDKRSVEIGGTIESSLYNSVIAAGEDMQLVSFLVDVFAYDLNFYVDQHKGDTFRLIVEKEFLDGEFLRYGRVLGAEWKGKAGNFHAFWWKIPGGKTAGKYFNEKGQSVEKTFLKTPLKFSRISSKFNPRRMHPILHKRSGHFGVDYAAPTGTPIWAAASGKIVWRARKGGAGNLLVIRHDNGLSTLYMHLSKFKKGQKVGTRVRQKQVVGYVGTTGLSTGPHLHFSVKKNGRYIDPLKMKMARSAPVAKKHMAAFKADTAKLVERLAKIDPASGVRDVTGEELATDADTTEAASQAGTQ
jgi:murein DD-endopeptidase MepM/ murein hydrolase activator NlpD